ncbi:MAG: hypothetical protein GY769_07805 [bacterium]|nr:hypothetical protein [bacterium]
MTLREFDQHSKRRWTEEERYIRERLRTRRKDSVGPWDELWNWYEPSALKSREQIELEQKVVGMGVLLERYTLLVKCWVAELMDLKKVTIGETAKLAATWAAWKKPLGRCTDHIVETVADGAALGTELPTLRDLRRFFLGKTYSRELGQMERVSVLARELRRMAPTARALRGR